MTATYILRIWLPDRPGALGAVASRVGAVGGDVVAIEVLERGAGRAIDELVVELPGPDRVDLLLNELQEVDGIDVEQLRPAADALHDPRLDALETAAVLVGAGSTGEALSSLCERAVQAIGAEWGVVVALNGDGVVSAEGDHPELAWLVAFVAGSQSSARVSEGSHGPDDVVWAPLPCADMALVLGRDGQAFRARERRQVAALARIVDTRFRELNANECRLAHPSSSRR
jgi:hypothetical protein